MNREGVGLADAQEAPELKKLWRLSFPEDTEEGVAFFFQRVFQPLNCVVFRQEGRPVSHGFSASGRAAYAGGTDCASLPLRGGYPAGQTGARPFARVLCEIFRVGRERGWRPPASCRRSRDWPPIMPGSATVPFFGPS